jgi:hypothetical protein
MTSIARRAERSPTRSRLDHFDARLRRYDRLYQARVRALASRHERLAQLAESFPALLFALAVPRPEIDAARAISRVIAGAALSELAVTTRIPLWVRKLPPETFVRSIPDLPSGKILCRRIANHLPAAGKRASEWLQAVADATQWSHELFAVWVAREQTRAAPNVPLARLRLLALFAWFSRQPGTRGYDLMEKPWSPSMGFGSATAFADRWCNRIDLEIHLGGTPIADMWLEPGHVDGYDFVPLRTVADLKEEAAAMRNCVCTYGASLARNGLRLWSVRRDGARVATLAVGLYRGDPLPAIVQLLAANNKEAPPDIWWAARQWLHAHDLPSVDMKRRRSAPLHEATWIALWRPYWLAKRRIPSWLPLRPSRAALMSL